MRPMAFLDPSAFVGTNPIGELISVHDYSPNPFADPKKASGLFAASRITSEPVLGLNQRS
jgi:hypothetical protein